MSMILSNKFKQLKAGYPTMSDKYDVRGGISASEKVKPGQIVQDDGGSYTSTINSVGNKYVVLATNVKANDRLGSNEVVYKANEPIDVMIYGYVAVPFDGDVNRIEEGGKVYCTAEGIATTIDSNNECFNMRFTGLYEKQKDNSVLAEIVLK